MHMRPGLEVLRQDMPNFGKGQIVGIDNGVCMVLWQRGHKRECHAECDLLWRGLAVHTCDGRPGKVVTLGYNRVRVRLSSGACPWMPVDDLARREPK